MYKISWILCLWFRASLIYIYNCPTRCNTKQSIYYSASSVYMFGCQPHPSSGVHRTVTTASGTGNIFLCNYLPPTWPSLATLEGGRCTVPEAVVTVLCTPDDGCGWHPKHVEWTCRIINRLPCVASRLTIINPLKTNDRLLYLKIQSVPRCKHFSSRL